MYYTNKKIFRYFDLEAIIWITALIILAFSPINSSCHYSLCPLHNLGFSWCPGCGLGRSITLLFHGEFSKSWSMHPLGIPAVLIIVFRIINIYRRKFNYLKRFGYAKRNGTITEN